MPIEVAVASSSAVDATSWYRSYGPLNALKLKHGISLNRLSQVTWAELGCSDVLFLQRPHAPEHIALIKLAKSIGVKVWCDYDDLLCSLTPDNPAFDYFGQFSSNIMFAIQNADWITVSTQFLRDEYFKHNKNISVVPNAWNDIIHPKPFNNDKKRQTLGPRSVFWRGTDTHIKDLHDVRDEIKALSKLSAWSYMGFCPWFLRDTGQKINPLDIVTYMDFMQRTQFSVVVVPLHDSPFNRAKSNIAWIEGTVAGAVCVAPDFAEWKRPGVINYSSSLSFSDAVEEALLRSSDGAYNAMSRAFVDENLMLSKVNFKRLEVLEKLTGKKTHE